MEQRVSVKQEYIGGSSSSSRRQWSDGAPRPMEGLHEAAPPPFLTKTYEMVDDLSTDRIVSWSRGGQSFAVWDPHAFSTIVLPGYFKHNNFSSFGFRKVDADKWEFANDSFLQGQKHLLKNIRRRKTSAHLLPQHQSIGPCLELGRFGLNTEIDRLRRDKQVLMMELVKLKQQQMNSKAYLQEMELRLQKTEHKQHQMMSFLAKAMQNPEFIHQLVHQKEKRKELEEVISKKRRRPIEDGESSHGNPVKSEPLDFGVAYGFQVSELEALALEMQGIGRAKREDQEEIERLGCYDKELDEGFWEELLNDGFDDDEENADVLADRLEFLGSSPK